MQSFANIITDVFDNSAEERLELDDERATIAAAKLGDETAKLRLILAYAPALRSGVAAMTRAYASTPQPADVADIRMQAVIGLLTAIENFDPEKNDRLAGLAREHIYREVVETEAPAFSIPPRTVRRCLGILREAEGDVAKALELAPAREMRPETFSAVIDALRNVESYDVLTAATADDGPRDVAASPVWDGSHADVEDRILVEAAFRSIDGVEKTVTKLAYGFSDYEPVADGEIADRLGLSRQKAQRVRSSALVKMRSALGVA